jgi:hypothetical protein
MAVVDLCRFNPTLGGTTSWVYSTAVAGCQSPSLANMQNGLPYKVYAVSADLSQWEISQGVYNSSTGTIPRTVVLYNSLGTGTAAGQSGAGTLINFSTVPQVAVVALMEDLSPIVLRSYLAGLTLSAAGSSATFGIAAGITADSTTTDLMMLATAYTKTTSAWALGTGVGALDTGTVAVSTWYHVHIIKREDTGVVDVLFSLSATAPTMPTNYTLFRRIGSMKTDGSSNWVAFVQSGDDFNYSTSTTDINTTALGATATTYSMNVPTGLKVDVKVRANAYNASNYVLLLLSSPDESDQAPSASAGVGTLLGSPNLEAFATVQIRTNTSGQIRARSNFASTTLVVATFGYVDHRGRDA